MSRSRTVRRVLTVGLLALPVVAVSCTPTTNPGSGPTLGAGTPTATGGVITACAQPGGALRSVSDPSECVDGESVLSWNMVGPAGPQGETGPQGPAGPSTPDPRFGNNTGRAPGEGKGADCTIGEILLTGIDRVAQGLPADGRLLPVSKYGALNALYGTKFGGDGVTTFALPNLQSAAPNGLTYSVCVNGLFPTGPL